jgi:hypothetical protein
VVTFSSISLALFFTIALYLFILEALVFDGGLVYLKKQLENPTDLTMPFDREFKN